MKSEIDIKHTREEELKAIEKLEQKIAEGTDHPGGLTYFGGMPSIGPSDKEYLEGLKERLNDNSRWVLVPEHLIRKPKNKTE